MTRIARPAKIALVLVSLLGLSAAVSAASVPPGPASAHRTAPTSYPATSDPATASPTERAALIRQFVRKWGGYAERVYGVDVGVWSQRMVPTFAHGDVTNLREALRRETFEGALASLTGRGARTADAAIVDGLARTGAGTSPARVPVVARALGDLAQDLVFTPVQPCRIVDTRNALGAIQAGLIRSYRVTGKANYLDQGGSSTNCTLQTEQISAAVLYVTAVTPAGAGYATVYPYATNQPSTSNINYSAGDIVNGAAIVRVPNPATTYDFTIFSYATSDYVIDVVGYYAPPRATALSCYDTALTTTNIAAGGTGQATAPACQAGFTATGLDCESTSWSMPIVFSSLRGGSVCGARNGGATTASLKVSQRCCRVPGR